MSDSTPAAPVSDTGRQLAYSCAARLPGADRGGWGVLHRRGVDPSLESRLLTRVSTRVVAPHPMPPFPGPEDLDRRVRRLRSQLLDARLVLAHAVDAGPDPTGRPGNVFNHLAVLDGTRRGIQWWRSPQWCVPYGSVAVAGAHLPEELAPGPLTRAAVLDWLRSTAEGAALGWIIDTVVWGRATGRTVVLVTEQDEDVAHWIAALSWLGPAPVVGALAWSTFEDVHSLSWAVQQDYAVVGVHPAAAAVARELGCLTIDPRDEPEQRERGWRLGDGTEIPSSTWQQVVYDILQLEDPGGVLGAADAIASEVAYRAGTPVPFDPSWALGLALLSTPEALDRRGLAEAVLSSTPERVSHPALTALLAEFPDLVRPAPEPPVPELRVPEPRVPEPPTPAPPTPEPPTPAPPAPEPPTPEPPSLQPVPSEQAAPSGLSGVTGLLWRAGAAHDRLAAAGVLDRTGLVQAARCPPQLLTSAVDHLTGLAFGATLAPQQILAWLAAATAVHARLTTPGALSATQPPPAAQSLPATQSQSALLLGAAIVAVVSHAQPLPDDLHRAVIGVHDTTRTLLARATPSSGGAASPVQSRPSAADPSDPRRQ